ncbi:MAG TPA: DUF2079 domain-containing protein, partial [Bacteroidia bacterium]|nr:DUF2079 domain-containing protein [Bacteroidia bacterium]
MNTSGIKPSISPKLCFRLIMFLFGGIYFITAIGNHYFFRTTNEDYGVYNFAFWDYSHFHVSKLSVLYYSKMTLMQDHFSLTLMYFVPVYWLLNWLTGTYTLVLIQAAMLLAGAWATYKVVTLKTADAWLGIGALLYYFLLQGHFSAFEGDFNITVVASSFIPLFLYYFELKKYLVATTFFVLAIFSKENFPLWFISILPVVMMWHYKDKKILAICLAYIFAAVFYFVLVFKVIIPHFESAGRPYNLFNYSALGQTPFDAVKFIIHNPIETLELFFTNQNGNPFYNGIKKEFYLVYFISGGFMLLFRQRYLIWFIPIVAQKMLNDLPIRWSIELHYSIEVATMMPLAVFFIVATLKNKKIQYVLTVVICILTLGTSWYKMNINNRALKWDNPVKENVLDTDFFRPGFNAGDLHKALSLIPADAKVSASATIVPHLAQRKSIYEFPQIDDAEYIAAYTFRDYYLLTPAEYDASLYQYVFSPDWKIIADVYPLIILKKEPGKHNGLKGYDSITCGVEKLSPDKQHFLASDGQLIDNINTRDSTKAHNGRYSVMLTKDKPYSMTFRDKNISTGDLLQINAWRYSEDKKNGALVISSGTDYLLSVDTIGKDSLG